MKIPWRNVRVGMRVRGSDGMSYSVSQREDRRTGTIFFRIERPGRVIEREFSATSEVELAEPPPPEVVTEIRLTEFAEDQGIDVRHTAAAMVLAGFPGATIEADGQTDVSPPDPRTIACPVTYKEAGALASHLSILHGVAAPDPKAKHLRGLRDVHDAYHADGILDPRRSIEPGGRMHTHDDALYLSRFAHKPTIKGEGK